MQTVLVEHRELAHTGPEAPVVFRDNIYPARELYRGRFKFAKHFFPYVGGLDTDEK